MDNNLIGKVGSIITIYFSYVSFTAIDIVMKLIAFVIACAVGGTTLYLNILKIKKEKKRKNGTGITGN